MDSMICEVVQEAGKLIARCPEHHEGFIDLLLNLDHWGFEYISGIITAAVISPFVPSLRKLWRTVKARIPRVGRWAHEHDKCCYPQGDEDVRGPTAP